MFRLIDSQIDKDPQQWNGLRCRMKNLIFMRNITYDERWKSYSSIHMRDDSPSVCMLFTKIWRNDMHTVSQLINSFETHSVSQQHWWDIFFIFFVLFPYFYYYYLFVVFVKFYDLLHPYLKLILILISVKRVEIVQLLQSQWDEQQKKYSHPEDRAEQFLNNVLRIVNRLAVSLSHFY